MCVMSNDQFIQAALKKIDPDILLVGPGNLEHVIDVKALAKEMTDAVLFARRFHGNSAFSITMDKGIPLKGSWTGIRTFNKPTTIEDVFSMETINFVYSRHGKDRTVSILHTFEEAKRNDP